MSSDLTPSSKKFKAVDFNKELIPSTDLELTSLFKTKDLVGKCPLNKANPILEIAFLRNPRSPLIITSYLVTGRNHRQICCHLKNLATSTGDLLYLHLALWVEGMGSDAVRNQVRTELQDEMGRLFSLGDILWATHVWLEKGLHPLPAGVQELDAVEYMINRDFFIAEVKQLEESLGQGAGSSSQVLLSSSDSSLVVKPSYPILPSVLKPTSETLNTIPTSSNVGGTRTALDQIYTPLTVDISAQPGTLFSVSAPLFYDSWIPLWDDTTPATGAEAAKDVPAGTRSSFEEAPSASLLVPVEDSRSADIGRAAASAAEWFSLLDFNNPSYIPNGVFFPYLSPMANYGRFAAGKFLELTSKFAPDKSSEGGEGPGPEGSL